MNFYTSIRPWYDQIFPIAVVQRDFVLSFGSDPAHSIVDVGCGTGTLIVQLAGIFRKTAGLDPDGAMLEAARQKAARVPAGTWFIQAGMLDLTRELAPQSANRLICFGNTVPHLTDEGEVMEFAGQAHQILKPGGLILIQIINYDRILDQKLGGLPTIENDEFKFERRYQYPDNAKHIQFKTRLTLKATGQIIENEVPLLALRPARLRRILEESGFSGIEEYGSFRKESFTADSQPYIIKAGSTVG